MSHYPCRVIHSLDEQLSYPHYSDKRWDEVNTIFGRETSDLHYNYDDRLYVDGEAHRRGEAKAKNETRNTARYWLEYLKAYYEKDILLKYIGAGSNRSSGYPYWVLGYKILDTEPTTEMVSEKEPEKEIVKEPEVIDDHYSTYGADAYYFGSKNN